MLRRTQRWTVVAAAAVLLAAGWGCRKDRDVGDEESLPPASFLSVARPRAQRQLLDGFWSVENNSWRWTRHNFSVLLAPPARATQKGAMLELRFTITDGLIAKRKSVTLSASINNAALAPHTYDAAGSYTYTADVPAEVFKAGGAVRVDFSTDNYLRAGEVEARELALVVHTIGLSPK